MIPCMRDVDSYLSFAFSKMGMSEQTTLQIDDQETIGSCLASFLTEIHTTTMQKYFFDVLHQTKGIKVLLEEVDPALRYLLDASFTLLSSLYAHYAYAIMIDQPSNLQEALRYSVVPSESIARRMIGPFWQFLEGLRNQHEEIETEAELKGREYSDLEKAVGKALIDYSNDVVRKQFTARSH